MEAVMEVNNSKIAKEWVEGKTIYEGPVTKKPQHLCYICGNEGFVSVGQGLYRCYRETCVYRDSKGLVTGELAKKVCYVCGRVGETHERKGTYKGLDLFRCSNNILCQLKLIRGIKLIYTDTGVYKYDNKSPKDQPPIALTDNELKLLKIQELKDRMEQIQDKKYKPSTIELVTISLQEKYYAIQELADKLNVPFTTVRAIIPYQIKKAGYNVSTITGEDKILKYKIEEFKAVEVKKEEQPVVVKTKVSKPYIPSIPTSGKALVLYNLLKTGEYTIPELIEKAEVTEATVKIQLNWHLKKAGVNVVKIGDKYSIK